MLSVAKGSLASLLCGLIPTKPIPDDRGGSPQTCATARWRHGVAICLHKAEWHCISCAPTEQRACKHHDRWHAQCGCPQPASPAADMQTVVAWGQSGVPRRPKWGTRGCSSSLSKCCPSGMLPFLVKTSENHNFWKWILAVHSMTAAIQAPTTTLVLTYPLADTAEPPHNIAMAINLHLQEALEWLQWVSPAASAPVSQHSMPRRKPPSVALGALPSTGEMEDPLRPEEMDSGIPALTATLTQMPLWAATPGDIPASLMSFTHHSIPPCWGHQNQPACTHSPRVVPAILSDKLLLQENEQNCRATACSQILWESLLQRAGLKCRTGSLSGQSPDCQGHQTGQGVWYNHSLYIYLQQVHKESVLALEHQVMEEERWAHQAFVEAFWAAIGTCLPAWELGPTSVPTTAPDEQCAASHPSWDVGYLPIAGHGRWRTSTCSPCPKSAGDASTTNRHKTLVPFLRPRCTGPLAGGGGNGRYWWSHQRASSL